VWSFGHDQVYVIGFSVITVLLAVGLVQSALVRRGRSLFPWLDYSRLTSRLRRTPKRGAADPGRSASGTTDPAAATTAWTAGTPRPQGPNWPAGPPGGPPGPTQAWTYGPVTPPPAASTSRPPTAPPTLGPPPGPPIAGSPAGPGYGAAPTTPGTSKATGGTPPAGPAPAHRPVRDAGTRRPKEQG